MKAGVCRAYRSNWEVMFHYENPFDHSNAEYQTLLNIGDDGNVKEHFKIVILLRKAKGSEGGRPEGILPEALPLAHKIRWFIFLSSRLK